MNALCPGALVLFAIAFVGACDALSPPPTVPHPQTLAWSDARLDILTDAELSCEDRLRELAYQGRCARVPTAMGEEVRCSLTSPAGVLAVGCGRDDENPAERLRIAFAGEEADAAVGFTDRLVARYGACTDVTPPTPRPEALERSTRRPDACFFLASPGGDTLPGGYRTLGEEGMRFPMGLFLIWRDGLSPDALSALRKRGPAGSGVPRFDALVIETELLRPAGRSRIWREVSELLDVVAAP